MPTKIRSGASGKSPLETTSSSVISAPVKKLRKMILPAEETVDAIESQAPIANMGIETNVEASNATEAVNSSIILDLIFDFVLDSSYPQFVTHIPTLHQSPTHSSEHTPSPKLDIVLPLEFVMSSPQLISNSDYDESDF
ncbi:unnamed protein product [Vicia faba]|uniref:Uncharacterized protein n=1 Tax=Vicia faba TaxID=3906 RepID=A0AAV1B7T0_VICFA|nr:unnamed protein product [Vicia faba]